MKTFILKVIFYLMLLILIILGTFFSITNHFRKYPFHRNYQTIFLGDSRVQYLYFNRDNLAHNSESYKFSFFKLKSINQLHHIDTVYVGCSHHSFSGYFNQYINNQDEVIPRYFVISPDKSKILLDYQFLQLHFLIKKQVELAWESLYHHKNYIPGGFASPFDRVVDFNKVKKRIQQQFFRGKSIMPFSAEQLQYFDSIVHFCKLNQTQLILINTPVHPEYKKQIPQKYIQKYLQKTQNLQILDLSNYLAKNDEFMPDGDHISWKAYLKTTHEINLKRHEFSLKKDSLNVCKEHQSHKN